MNVQRPVQVLFLSLLTALNTARIDADPLDIASSPGKIPPTRSMEAAQLQESSYLERAIDNAAGLFFNSGPMGPYLGKLYVDRVSKDARYPEACRSQLQTMLILDATGQQIKNGKGAVLAEFSESDALILHDRLSFAATNMCRIGPDRTSERSLLTSEGFVMRIEDAMNVKSLDNPAAEQAFATYAGYDIMTKAANIPECNRDLTAAIIDIKNLYRDGNKNGDTEFLISRSHVIRRLAERDFVEDDGVCPILILPIPTSGPALTLAPSLP